MKKKTLIALSGRVCNTVKMRFYFRSSPIYILLYFTVFKFKI